MTRGKRTRIAAGVYRDRAGIAATVKVGNRQREKRFAADTPLEEIKSWQATVRAFLWKLAPRAAPPTVRGTLKGDVAVYLKQLEGRPSYKSDASHLAAWLPVYGPRRRASLKPEDVIQAIATWRTEGVAAQTIIHRCRVLRQLFHALDGATESTPVDHVPRPSKPKPIPVSIPKETIAAVGGKLEKLDRLTAARYWVLAATGARPAEVMRAKPEDVQLKRAVWLVRAAKGSTVRELPLNREMTAAWRRFIKVQAWGAYDSGVFTKLLRRAGWPLGIRPYNLRHSFAVDALMADVDLGDVQGMLGHANIETTRTYYAGILQERLQRASVKIDGRFAVQRPISLSKKRRTA